MMEFLLKRKQEIRSNVLYIVDLRTYDTMAQGQKTNIAFQNTS
jgi:hypothetical protein